ncbi:MAG: MlaD family protein [Vicinamibacterales bacterium]
MPSPARLAGVGVFVLGTLLLFGAGLFLIADRRMAFSDQFTIYADFGKVTGLQPGAIVRVSGARAGSVTEIVPPRDPAGKFRVTLEVAESLHQLVRADSVASIETEGLVGGAYLAIDSGTAAAPQAPPLSTIAGEDPFEVADLLQQMNATIVKVNGTIDDVRGEMEQTLLAVSETVNTTNQLIASVSTDVKRMTSAGARVTSDLADLTTDIRAGQGTVGKLFKDDELYTRLTGIATRGEQVATDAQAVVAQARLAIERVQGNDGQISGIASQLRQTIDDARTAVSGFAENMEALRHNFLLRGFFNDRGYFNLADITPAEYRAGALSRSGRRAVRVWLDSARLFDPDAEGSDELSPEGRLRLDSAIAPYLDRLGDAVLMVEGFAQGGARDQQFLTSRARAARVREYLVQRFHLDPKATGVMPLSDESQGSPAGDQWDGVALAVFLQER